ncbi:hypothetical protein QNH39_10135 [Neobacillus novalis]|uniref:Uncharacterized protein n=1 Tax=Neobacillus novalis TaxID=220687 RepID=A0AA95SAJ4_9BACI|nr:hypothetical protein [Neobacillus novalis]WHY88170.1 hypothetical protein QNH39_10135 [Neobacillus novalis]
MAKWLPSSIKWLLFTFFSSVLTYCFTGLSTITICTFLTGFIFSIGYLYKNN